MGATVADLTGDGTLDGYVSDIGGNEFLDGDGVSFTPWVDSGASRIRPPGASDAVVSSSWGSGATDINLDGIADIVVVTVATTHGSVTQLLASFSFGGKHAPGMSVGSLCQVHPSR